MATVAGEALSPAQHRRRARRQARDKAKLEARERLSAAMNEIQLLRVQLQILVAALKSAGTPQTAGPEACQLRRWKRRSRLPPIPEEQHALVLPDCGVDGAEDEPRAQARRRAPQMALAGGDNPSSSRQLDIKEGNLGDCKCEPSEASPPPPPPQASKNGAGEQGIPASGEAAYVASSPQTGTPAGREPSVVDWQDKPKVLQFFVLQGIAALSDRKVSRVVTARELREWLEERGIYPQHVPNEASLERLAKWYVDMEFVEFRRPKTDTGQWMIRPIQR